MTSSMCLYFSVFAAICWMKTKWHWLNNLPGDLKITVGNAQVCLPLGTCLISSVVVAIIMMIVGQKQ